jgi:hypothetical protein
MGRMQPTEGRGGWVMRGDLLVLFISLLLCVGELRPDDLSGIIPNCSLTRKFSVTLVLLFSWMEQPLGAGWRRRLIRGTASDDWSDLVGSSMMDEIAQFLRTVFTPGELVVAPAHLVAALRIPDRSKEFLINVGLPRSIDIASGTIEFNRLETLPTLGELLPAYAARIDPGWEDCRFLAAEEDATGYVINQSDNGSIWAVDSDWIKSEFINSSVELFGWFLAAYAQLGRSPASSRAGFLAALKKMEHQMEVMDSRATTGESIFWPSIIEDGEIYPGLE